MSEKNRLEVFVSGGHAGTLTLSDEGLMAFSYDAAYGGPDLSVTMPLGGGTFQGACVLAWFENLLPDDPAVRRGMAGQASVANGIFPLLSQFGLDLPGAVQVVPADGLEALLATHSGYAKISRSKIGERLEHLAGAQAENSERSWASREEHWSLGGMQTKLAFYEQQGEWFECLGAAASNVIVKPGAWGLSDQALVECFTMKLAKRCGLPVADVSLESFGETAAIVSKRYDRFIAEPGGDVLRLHQEDLCQATSTLSSKKYAEDGGPTSADAMEVLKGAEGKSAMRFTDALLFNALTASTDAHGKNYSLLHPAPGRCLLAPLYDLASALPYMEKGRVYRLAMSIGGENRVGWLRKTTLERFARLHGLEAGEVITRAEELAALVEAQSEAAFYDCGAHPAIDRIAAATLPGLRALCEGAQRNIAVSPEHFKPVAAGCSHHS